MVPLGQPVDQILHKVSKSIKTRKKAQHKSDLRGRYHVFLLGTHALRVQPISHPPIHQ
jgi:hypothetical protein